MSESKFTSYIPVEVVYQMHPGCLGARDSLNGVPGAGPQLEPDEPTYCEILATMLDGSDILESLSDTIIERLKNEALDNDNDEPDTEHEIPH